jgi:CheY-like chemotaxis protein
MQSEILKNAKLESVGVLAGGIAHDFNNILSVLLGNIQLAKMKLARGDNISKYLNALEDTIGRATGLTQQLLTFSKGGAPVVKTSSINDLVKDTIPFTLSGSNVNHKLDLAENINTVDIDENQIGQVLTNIVINAIQAMPEGGHLMVSTRNVSIDEQHPVGTLKSGQYVAVSIKDTGIGIPQKIINKIFDPFYSTKATGSGLGLATCYSIINKHSGYITVESVPGEGANFTFYLPASIKAVSKERQTAIQKTFSGRVLLLDDQPAVRDFMKSLLTELGLKVDTAESGKETMLKYEEGVRTKHPYDLLLLDLTIPGGIGGKEVITQIRAIDEDVKSIAYSGYADDPVISDPKRFGFNESLSKPVNINKLAKILNNLFGNSD